MGDMPTTKFSTRMDEDLKARLERVAEFENRSTSYVANQAIKAVVEEREQTHELVKVGLQLVDQGQAISEQAVDVWLRADGDTPFPEPDTTTR